MTDWERADIDVIGRAEELRIAPQRQDGSTAPWVPIWVVRVGDALFVRSYRGAGGRWFREAMRSGSGRIAAGGIERDARFVASDDADRSAVGVAYRRKYARFGGSYVVPMVADAAAASTLRVLPGGSSG